MLNSDYKEMLLCLKEEGVKFLLVGAYAMAGHGYVRATVDIDIWVKPESENSKAVIRALKKFGAYLHDLCEADLENDDTVFQIGVPPRRIDILTGVSGLDFDITFANSTPVKIECIELRIPSIQDLIKNKKSSGRIKTLLTQTPLKRSVSRVRGNADLTRLTRINFFVNPVRVCPAVFGQKSPR